MKKSKKLLSIFFTFALAPLFAHADIMLDCMTAISNSDAFYQAMTQEIFPNVSDLNQEYVTTKKNQILAAIGATLLAQQNECTKNISTLAKQANGKVWYTRDDKTYAFQFKMADMFAILNIPVGIMLYNNLTKSAGDVIKLSDVPKLYWSKSCSDHVIWDNLDDDAGVNIAGQKVFPQYGGSDNEFFLDFEEGNNRRAFPGLVLMDETGTTSEHVVQFSNLHTAIDATQKFASALGQTSCANDGLAAYVVSLDTRPIGSDDKDGFGYAAGIIGGATTLVTTTAALAVTGVATAGILGGIGKASIWLLGGGAAAAGAAGGTAGAAGATAGAAAASATVPVAGWVVAGVLAVVAGGLYAYSMVPSEIADIQQVMVLDGPYMIK